jgi:Mn-dependent DtxR family transcriptional regulator
MNEIVFPDEIELKILKAIYDLSPTDHVTLRKVSEMLEMDPLEVEDRLTFLKEKGYVTVRTYLRGGLPNENVQASLTPHGRQVLR